MKQFAWLPVVLLLGLLIGSWAPRSEIHRLRKELDTARKAGRKVASGTARMTGVASLLGIDASSSGDSSVQAEASPSAAIHVETSEVAVADLDLPTNTESDIARNNLFPTNTPSTSEDFKKQIEHAAELWRMRADVARATFVSDAELSQRDQDNLDVLLEAMNLRMADRIEKWVKQVENGMDPGPEAGIRLVRDVTDVLTFTYDELDRKLEPGWRENVEKPLNLTDYIDPEVALPLVDVKDKLEFAN